MDTDGRFARWLRKDAHLGNMVAGILLWQWILAVVLLSGYGLWRGELVFPWWVYLVTALVTFLIFRSGIMEALDRRAVHWVAARERENERRKAKAESSRFARY